MSTYQLAPGKTVRFVFPRPSMFPEMKAEETSRIEGIQNSPFPFKSVSQAYFRGSLFLERLFVRGNFAFQNGFSLSIKTA